MTDVSRFSVSIPLMLMYGYKPESFEDPALAAAETSLELGFQLYLPGATLANIFPILLHVPSWFPGAQFKRTAKRVRALTDEVKRIPLEFVKSQFVGLL